MLMHAQSPRPRPRATPPDTHIHNNGDDLSVAHRLTRVHLHTHVHTHECIHAGARTTARARAGPHINSHTHIYTQLQASSGGGQHWAGEAGGVRDPHWPARRLLCRDGEDRRAHEEGVCVNLCVGARAKVGVFVFCFPAAEYSRSPLAVSLDLVMPALSFFFSFCLFVLCVCMCACVRDPHRPTRGPLCRERRTST